MQSEQTLFGKKQKKNLSLSQMRGNLWLDYLWYTALELIFSTIVWKSLILTKMASNMMKVFFFFSFYELTYNDLITNVVYLSMSCSEYIHFSLNIISDNLVFFIKCLQTSKIDTIYNSFNHNYMIWFIIIKLIIHQLREEISCVSSKLRKCFGNHKTW